MERFIPNNIDEDYKIPLSKKLNYFFWKIVFTILKLLGWKPQRTYFKVDRKENMDDTSRN